MSAESEIVPTRPSGAPAVPRFQSGGSLEEGALYVERPADRQLVEALLAGELAYVLATRQIGKSSLRARTVARLRERGVRCASVDLTKIGGKTVSADEWYFGLVEEAWLGLALPGDAYEFWSAHAAASPVHRWSRFLREVVLASAGGKVVLFIDEIDQTLALPFSRDDFFASVRALHNERADRPDARRLTFCLLGVAAPGQLMEDASQTPFNVGRAVRLDDFTRADLDAFAPGLAPAGGDPARLLDAVHEWAGGHPYMTQRLCDELVRTAGQGSAGDEAARVARAVEAVFLGRGRVEDLSLRYAELRVETDELGVRASEKLSLYQRVVESPTPVAADGEDPVQMALRLAGLCAERGGTLAVRNRIYATVFDAAWVKKKQADRLLAEPLQRWMESGKQEDYLLRGTALRDAREWEKGRADLSPDEREFIMAGLDQARREEEARKERAIERAKLDAAESRQRAQRQLIVLLAILAAVMTALGGLAFREYRKEREAHDEALRLKAEADAARLEAEEARKQLQEALDREVKASTRVASLSAQVAKVVQARAPAAEGKPGGLDLGHGESDLMMQLDQALGQYQRTSAVATQALKQRTSDATSLQQQLASEHAARAAAEESARAARGELELLRAASQPHVTSKGDLSEVLAALEGKGTGSSAGIGRGSTGVVEHPANGPATATGAAAAIQPAARAADFAYRTSLLAIEDLKIARDAVCAEGRRDEAQSRRCAQLDEHLRTYASRRATMDGQRPDYASFVPLEHKTDGPMRVPAGAPPRVDHGGHSPAPLQGNQGEQIQQPGRRGD